MKDYKLGLAIYPTEKLKFRFIQCGIMNKGKFTGHVIDYVGGGEYQDFYFLNGKNAESNSDCDADESIAKIEKKYPGLIKQIDDYESKYMKYNKDACNYVLKPVFKKIYTDYPIVYTEGVDIKLQQVGLTYFSKIHK